ncbi:MAG: thiamine pyrophosphate-binding protein [Deltaproteobacteria bacterium]|jgi:thiamine pyrophosphate-dependent acetolactate synthase large subunit-like protein|nr:thiamine pyrophosphate-binding protein [Deltaproteobacteria bacterium]
MIERTELLDTVQEVAADQIIVPVMSAIKGWNELPKYFYWCTAMGYGSSVGLGLALARPERKVIVLDGDGSLLMNLGSLVTIAGLSPPNLIHIVFENGLYELPGAIPLPGRGKASLSGMARAAGIESIHEYDEIGGFKAGLVSLLCEEGPTFVSAKVAPGSGAGLPRRTLVGITRRLEQALASAR